ncbi:MAG: glutamine synthetase family protein [Gammaproteobacteria bacterium]|nr:glutamine synthetase family protein [Gammaproteobacteria bacterium]
MHAWLTEHYIDEIEAIIPDMTGIARGKIIPAHKYSEDIGMRLPEGIFLQTVTGDFPRDESAINPAEIDMVLRPDPNSWRMVPWAKDPTALVIHDCYYADNSPVDISPRYVLRHILELYEQQGWRPVIAPELEFYLVKPNTDSDNPLEPPIGRSGRAETGRQSFSIDAVNEFDPLFEDVYDYCEAQHIEIDTLIHEAGAAQMEVNLLHGDPLELADQAFLFKRVLRESALQHKMYATFMGKPMENEPGSSMHIHQSVVDVKSGNNIFSREDDEASELFSWHIGGLQTYLPQAMALLAPNVNSYRRITRYLSAPINVEWGYDNRTAGLRVPLSPPQARRVENRVAGADANPYLAIAASLACGYLGMMEKIKPREPVHESAYNLPFELPRNLERSLINLMDCDPLKKLLGERFVRTYNAVKESEYEAFLHVISSWEREHLLLNV